MNLQQDISLWGDDIPWLAGLREKGFKAFQKSGWPTAKTEAWKYSYFKENCLAEAQIDTSEHICGADCHCHETNPLPFDAYVLPFCNGRPDFEHTQLPRGVTVKPLIEAIYDNDVKRWLGKSFEPEKFPFAALNTAYLEQGFMLTVERGTSVDKPLYVHYRYHGRSNLWDNPRNLIVIESGAQVTLLEHFENENDGLSFHNVVNEVFIGADAVLHHYKILDESPATRHIALTSVQIKRNGVYKSFYAQNECALSRQETFVSLQEEGASASVDGIYRLAANGVSDITTNIRHLAPHTSSDQLVKGVVSGCGKGVFQGQIHIAPDAQQTEGHQLHRALLLSDTAEVDCKPELEIFADDVKCSHGATCGDLDKEQLFYMQSRGIALDEAKQILIDAYLNEVLQRIDNADILNWIERKNDEK